MGLIGEFLRTLNLAIQAAQLAESGDWRAAQTVILKNID